MSDLWWQVPAAIVLGIAALGCFAAGLRVAACLILGIVEWFME